MKHNWLPQLAGPLLFILIVLAPAPPGMPVEAQYTAGITAWMAIWWITEVVHTAVTALLPLVLFPLCGVLPVKDVSAEFGNQIIFLFLAGFLFGRAIERWNLHTRIALQLVLWLGSNPARIVLGFMVATGFISMWISNTATAVMMTPVAIAVSSGQWVEQEQGNHNFRKALMLGVAYACSIGGMATIVGTPTNAIFLGFVQQEMHEQLSFWKWFVFAFPFAVVLLAGCWLLLIRLYPPEKNTAGVGYRQALQAEIQALGALSAPERRLMWLFGAVIVCWLTGSLLWYRWLPNCNDTVVATAGALCLFLLPAGNAHPGKPLLDWDNALRIQWGVLLFFGGGLALAKGFDSSGLAAWMGGMMESLRVLPPALIVLAVLVVVTLLSEIASNVATASMMMPVLAALAGAVGADPFGMLLSAALAASFGFGLPVATAPNTIVFSSGYLTTRDMARAGFLLDLIAILLLLGFLYFFLPLVWGIQL
ncbi:MAG: DASS family sodium-coupled anion symporter [Saprospirales bacterium]|nr:DASS family sodium-coupled anion symporter [Saprospirales bacterium]MBK8922034.1 DASS family sodium-coupled anion symporter [Saprospirales bacterium]